MRARAHTAQSVLLALLAALTLTSCSRSTPPARVVQISSREELIGGQRALGEIGDFKLSNGVMHAIVQNVGGFSRGFGAFGGSLIDVDLVRAAPSNRATGVRGHDAFTEMFPAFFMLGIEPDKAEIIADGSDGGPAILRVTGQRGNFLSIVGSINETLVPPGVSFSVDYVLEPGKQYLKIIVSLINNTTAPALFPLSMPTGFVTLLGETQRLFIPGKAGYDMRFRLEEVYAGPSALTALPGEVTTMVATEGDKVSYALAASPIGSGYLAGKPMYYPGARPDEMLIPIASGSFLGSYWGKLPPEIAPKKSYSYAGYLAVGGGDVAQAQEVIYGISDDNGRKSVPHGTLSGRVLEAGTLTPLEGISVVLQNDQGEYISQARTREGGLFTAPLPKGHYRAIAIDGTRETVKSADLIDVDINDTGYVELRMPAPASLAVTVRDEGGKPLPAKVSVEAVYTHQGEEPPRTFLYDLKIGERFLSSDFLPDGTNDNTRRYLERTFFAPDGQGGAKLKAGTYRVYVSRGPEYSLEAQEVELKAFVTTPLAFVLRQTAPTPGWVSADFHVHSINSIDSDMTLDQRVASYAAEGVDVVTSTDHNYVTDLTPSIEAASLSDWLKPIVGLELTTLEMGHFNGFPVQVSPGPVSHGSFNWFLRPPGELFAQLRGLGKKPEDTVVQVNHPRDGVLGYFNAFYVGTFTMEPYVATSNFGADQRPLPDGGVSPYHPSQFSLDFDALEVFNGKHYEIMHTYRVPADAGTDPTAKNLPCMIGQLGDCIPAAGEVTYEVPKTYDGGTLLQPAYPGALDDWYTLLHQKRHMVATGNSDSHGAGAEAGLPRTYVKVGTAADGSMRGLPEVAVMDGLRKGKAIVTNGPFVEAWVNGKEIGDTAHNSNGELEVRVKVQAASWVDVTRVRILRGGPDTVKPQLLATIPVPPTTEPVRLDVTQRYNVASDDGFIVVEVEGDETMWPVFTPYEISSLQISDGVGVIGASFGFSNPWGKFRPSLTHAIRPFAFTNPVWFSKSVAQPLRVAKPVLPVG